MAPLRAKSKQQIIRCFKIMEMQIDNLNKDALRKQYYKISRKYHPDLCDTEYSDGNMFAKMKASYDFLRNNMDIINENIDFIKEFNINQEKATNDIKISEENQKEEEIKKTNENLRLDKEEVIFKSVNILNKQTSNYKTIKNCFKIEKALDDLESVNYEELSDIKNKIEDIFDEYKPYKNVKSDYILVILSVIFAVIISIIAIPTTIWPLLILSFICLIGSLFLVKSCDRHKKNTVFYTELTGKTLK